MQLYFHMIPLLYIIWHNHLLNYRETSCPTSSKTNLPTPDCGEGKHIIYCRAPSKERGFPGDTSGKEPARKHRRSKRCRLNPWVEKIPWKRVWRTTPVFLPGESHGQRSLVGYSPQGCRVSNPD